MPDRPNRNNSYGSPPAVMITSPSAGQNWPESGGSYVVQFSYGNIPATATASAMCWVVQSGTEIWPAAQPSISSGAGPNSASASFSPSDISATVPCQIYVRVMYTPTSGPSVAGSDTSTATPQ